MVITQSVCKLVLYCRLENLHSPRVYFTAGGEEEVEGADLAVQDDSNFLER